MIVIYWGALVLVGLITVLTKVWTQIDDGSNFSTLNPLTCNPVSSQINFTAGQNLAWDNLTVDREWIQENGCIDPCQQSSFLWPPTIFRSYSDLQLLSQADIGTLNSYISDPETINGAFKFFDGYAYFGTVVGAFVFSEGIWALCFGRMTPHQARDVVYAWILWPSIRSSSRATRADTVASTRLRKRIAKYVANLAYTWAVIATILSVLLFLVNITAMEVFLVYFPQSESANHIGAWTPWANTGLVLFAALLARFHSQLVHSIGFATRQALSKMMNDVGRTRQAEPHRQREPGSVQPPLAGQVDSAFAEHQDPQGLLDLASKNVASTVHDLKKEWRLFKAFWENPDDS